MSYPKVPPKPTYGTVTKLSEQRRERLLKLKEHEELKGLLVSKFKAKYGKELGFIEEEVDKFIKNETLTEANLRKLYERIKNQETAAEPKRATSVKSSKPAASVRSKTSGISRQSKGPDQPGKNPTGRETDDDRLSIDSHKSSRYVPENDEDEWAAIIEHDTAQYYEEEQARKRRKHDNRVKMKRELDRQLDEKNSKQQREAIEASKFELAQLRNIELQAKREHDKEEEYKAKVRQEKQLRDRQLQEEKRRKKLDAREQREMDTQIVRRLQEELMNEQRTFEEKRKEELNYMQRMMLENESQKKKTLAQLDLEHQNDAKTQQNYGKMLDTLERDRLNELKAREERQQQLMARVTDTVLKEQNLKSKEEDLALLRQIQEREEIDREEDNRRLEAQKRQKTNTREYLDSQVREKNRRKELERQSQVEQASIWKKDTEEYQRAEEERRHQERLINLANAEALKLQIQDKTSKKKAQASSAEAALNKKA